MFVAAPAQGEEHEDFTLIARPTDGAPGSREARPAQQTLRFAWHLTSVAWVGFAGLLAMLASSPHGAGRTQAQVISVTFALSGALALIGSKGRHLSWIVFLAIAGLVWLGGL